MAQYLKTVEADSATVLSSAERELAALTQSKAWESTKTAADLAGIVDPTPASDLISLGMSAAEGDWVGALLSGVSFVPYLGDALAKPIKFARATKTLTRIEKQAAAIAKKIDGMKSQAMKIAQQKMAAAAERARRAEEAAAKCAKEGNVIGCNRWGSKLPKTKGTWAGERGNSRWTSEDGTVSITYEKGYPDFKSSTPKSLHPDGGGEVQILQKGDHVDDFKAARDAMRAKLRDPTWPGNSAHFPDGYTWHHKEDGVTMQLVRREVHAVAESGASHSGGVSIVNSPQF